jgi:PhzF family phenazine biosynthesis protein
MRAGDVHQLRVFVGDDALGNATGVVSVHAAEPRESMAGNARLLGYPDTAFVLANDAEVVVHSFSPFEEMRFCTQTLLATEAVWRATGQLAAGEPLLARTPGGTVRVVRHDDEPGGSVAYVDLPERDHTTRAPRGRLPLADRLLIADPLVVDTGRARVYCLLPEELIESVTLTPDTVRAFCADEDVSGLCLLAVRPGDGVRLRVFTMSLDGAEDAATGGAAGGVPIYGQHLGLPLDTAAVLNVHQGFGGPQTRGELRVRPLPDGGFAVGGRVVPVSVGRLSPDQPVTAGTPADNGRHAG